MQCPNCGFQNVPGLDSCVVCNGSLQPKTATGSVFPPRRKDRPLFVRLRYSWSNSVSAARLRQIWTDLRSIRIPRPTYERGAMPSWRDICQTFLSVIPGLGHMFVLRNRKLGLRLLLGWLGALLLAVVLYKTPLADLLVFGAIGASVLSVTSTICALWDKTRPSTQPQVRWIGVVALVIAMYLGTWTVVQMAGRDHFMIATITANLRIGEVVRGDSVVLRPAREFDRGHVVIVNVEAWHPGEAMAGPIVGTPGDLIEVRDRVYVNGLPTVIELPEIDPTQGFGAVKLRGGQYWLMPTFVGRGGAFAQDIASAGVVRPRDLFGRVAAVIGPPGHRKLLGTVDVFGKEHH